MTTVGPITSHTDFYNQAVTLGRFHAKTLGFLPEGAYAEYARRGQLLGATEESRLVGYAIYRIARDRAMLVHLCTNTEHRGRGIAKQLIREIARRTEDLRGLGLWCRSDYPEDKVWPRLGFTFVRQRIGRSAEGKPLSLWWLPSSCPDLLEIAEEPRLSTVVDTNVFLGIIDNSTDNVANGLRADWVQAAAKFLVTPEVRAELDRDPNSDRRQKHLAALQRLPVIRTSLQAVDDLERTLTDTLRPKAGVNNSSDIRHLSYAIAGGASVFLTSDRQLLSRRGVVRQRYGLRIMRPSEFVASLAEVRDPDLARPTILPDRTLRLVSAADTLFDIAIKQFLSSESGETRHSLEQLLDRTLSSGKSDARLLVDDEGPRALIIVSVYDGILRVPVFRTAAGVNEAVIRRYLLSWLIHHAIRLKLVAVHLTERTLPELLPYEAERLGYIRSHDGLWKLCLRGNYSPEQLEAALTQSRVADLFPAASRLVALACNISQGRDSLASDVERAIWPAHVIGVGIASYLVPIRTKWARELFDYDLSARRLFGPDQRLILNPYNTYYKSARGSLPPPGSRILWYVSAAKGIHGTGALRAVSLCDHSERMSAKRAFRVFGDLGIYRWADVLMTANGDPLSPVSVLVFSLTEQFSFPIDARSVVETAKLIGTPVTLRSTTKISEEMFLRMCALGDKNANGVVGIEA